ncbi:hypothetical protein FOCC_FOCC004546 [Frankliniella occidentalis]|nr:hypothetical protein FOCC_FOCC004546 [Frankliniella occidentalis]
MDCAWASVLRFLSVPMPIPWPSPAESRVCRCALPVHAVAGGAVAAAAAAAAAAAVAAAVVVAAVVVDAAACAVAAAAGAAAGQHQRPHDTFLTLRNKLNFAKKNCNMRNVKQTTSGNGDDDDGTGGLVTPTPMRKNICFSFKWLRKNGKTKQIPAVLSFRLTHIKNGELRLRCDFTLANAKNSVRENWDRPADTHFEPDVWYRIRTLCDKFTLRSKLRAALQRIVFRQSAPQQPQHLILEAAAESVAARRGAGSDGGGSSSSSSRAAAAAAQPLSPRRFSFRGPLLLQRATSECYGAQNTRGQIKSHSTTARPKQSREVTPLSSKYTSEAVLEHEVPRNPGLKLKQLICGIAKSQPVQNPARCSLTRHKSSEDDATLKSCDAKRCKHRGWIKRTGRMEREEGKGTKLTRDTISVVRAKRRCCCFWSEKGADDEDYDDDDYAVIKLFASTDEEKKEETKYRTGEIREILWKKIRSRKQKKRRKVDGKKTFWFTAPLPCLKKILTSRNLRELAAAVWTSIAVLLEGVLEEAMNHGVPDERQDSTQTNDELAVTVRPGKVSEMCGREQSENSSAAACSILLFHYRCSTLCQQAKRNPHKRSSVTDPKTSTKEFIDVA